jgi:AraC-like DNA-binding protein
MTLAPVNLVQIALIAIGMLGFVLTVTRPRLRALAALMAMAVLWMVFNFLEETAGFRDVWLVTPAFRLAYPPLFFLLTRGLIFRGASLHWRDWPHAVPFLAGLMLTGSLLGLVELAARISLMAYSTAAVWLVHRFHLASRRQRSDARGIRMFWIYGVVAAFLADEVFDLFRMDFAWAQTRWPWLLSHDAYFLSLSISLVMTVILIVLAIRRQSLFEGLDGDALAAEPDSGRDASGFARLDETVRRDALYSEPRLTRAEVAAACGLSERAVSETIKAATGRNFNDYINALRIEDVKALLQARAGGGDGSSLLDIAYTAGFSSKSVFNAVFKRETGLTPSAYFDRLNAVR